MPRVSKAKDPQLARLALMLGEKLYKLADAYWLSETGRHICGDLDCYPRHAQEELKQLDEEERTAVMSARRGDGTVFYLNCCCLKGRLETDVHDYTFRRYKKQGTFGDALDRTRYEATIRKLVEICLQDPYVDALTLGDQLRDWTRSSGLLPRDDGRYGEVPGNVGRLAADGRCGEYLYLLALGDDEGARRVADNENEGMSPWQKAEANARSVEWLWHENDFDGALDQSYKLWLVNTLDAEGWSGADELVARLWLLKGFADVLDSMLVRDLALSVYCSTLHAALSFLTLPAALRMGPSHLKLRSVAANIANALSVCLLHKGRPKDAIVFCEWAHKEREALNESNGQDDLIGQEDLAKSLNNRGVCLDSLSRFDESMTYLNEALAIRSVMYKNGASQGDHYYAMSRNAIGVHHFRVARAAVEAGDLATAKEAYAAALEEHDEARRIRELRKASARWMPRYAASLHNMAGCHIGLASCAAPGSLDAIGHLRSAKELLGEALDIRMKCFESYPHIYYGSVCDTYNMLKKACTRMPSTDCPELQLDQMGKKKDESLRSATQKAKEILDGLGIPTKSAEIELVARNVLYTICDMSASI